MEGSTTMSLTPTRSQRDSEQSNVTRKLQVTSKQTNQDKQTTKVTVALAL